MWDWLRQVFWENEVGRAFLRVLLFVLPLLVLVPGCIWWERRLLSWMQDRIGPNRVATFTFGNRWPEFLRGKKIKMFGLLQPIADGVKLFFKEDITPKAIDGLIYFIAPAVALFPAFALGAVLPWGPNVMLTPIADVNIGVMYIFAISSLGVYGVVLAGYASNNKYSLLGGLRSSAQLISYELAMGMSLAAIVLATGSLKITEMVKFQEGPLWGAVPQVQNWFIFTPFGLVSAMIFAICVVAETNRAPFDLPEAENELIAGYHTEYSSMKFAVFFMGEYAAMFVFSGIFAAVFLGGYNLLPINWEAVGLPALAKWNATLAPLWFLGKCTLGITIFIWVRATLPRLRYDQLMSLGWKSLLPFGVYNFIVVATWILLTSVYGPAAGWVAAALAVAGLAFFTTIVARGSNARLDTLEKRAVLLTDGGASRAPKAELAEPGAAS